MELPNDIASCHEIILKLVSVLEEMKPQLQSYVQQIESQRTQIEAQRTQIAYLEVRVNELELKTKQNSKNSSRPPSSDMYRQKPAFPRKKGGKIGGKDGHGGGTLKMVSNPDFIIDHCVDVCTSCGKIHSQEPLLLRGRRQVFDIPPPRIEVTEHRVSDWVCCGCQHTNMGQFPLEVSAATQYGLRLQTASVLFNNAYNIPRNKIQLIFKDMYGISLNESTLQTQQEFAYIQLESDETYIKEQLCASPVTHFDETGYYVDKNRYWEHVASNDRYTYLFVHQKRGMEAHEADLSFLPNYSNWAVHDCWGTYFQFSNCKHAICGAHLLRELNALVENGAKWAVQFHAFLLRLYQQTDQAKGSLSHKAQKKALVEYKKLLRLADQEEPPPVYGKRGKPKKSKGRNLFDRLEKHQQAVLAFAFYPEVPFTNNQAERDIRPTKTKIKVSGCFRTILGAQIYARVQSFASTVRKQQFNLFNELYTVLSGGIPEYRTVPISC